MSRRVVAVHQPNYAPWLGWFAKAVQADTLVLLGNVQFSKGSYTNRVRVKGPRGPQFLTVPVRRASHRRTIDEMEIAAGRPWHVEHLRKLEHAYGGSPGWERHGKAVREILESGETSLARLNGRLIRLLLDVLKIGTEVIDAASLGDRVYSGSDGNLEICRKLGATSYLSGSGARAYNDPESFAAAGIDLTYSRFEHPTYVQPHGDFEAGLSALDLVFCVADEAGKVLRSGIAGQR